MKMAGVDLKEMEMSQSEEVRLEEEGKESMEDFDVESP